MQIPRDACQVIFDALTPMVEKADDLYDFPLITLSEISSNSDEIINSRFFL
jgi:hypothetical protein